MNYHIHADGSVHENCNCNHDHEHEHEHEHEHKQYADFVNISEHEGALICSANLTADIDFRNIQKLLITEMEKLSNFIIENGGLIGHIKVFVKNDDSWAQISITKQKAHMIQSEKIRGDKAVIQFAAIVFNIETEKLLLGVKTLLKEIENYSNI